MSPCRKCGEITANGESQLGSIPVGRKPARPSRLSLSGFGAAQGTPRGGYDLVTLANDESVIANFEGRPR